VEISYLNKLLAVHGEIPRTNADTQKMEKLCYINFKSSILNNIRIFVSDCL